MNERRVCVLLMDSLGIGASLDAAQYGDADANTFGHIVMACNTGVADNPSVRQGSLYIPHLAKRGLYHAAVASSGAAVYDVTTLSEPQSIYGYAVEQSLGKDTPSGHWELAGVPVFSQWGYFPNKPECFPKTLIEELIHLGELPGVLGEKHASGTTIIDEYGAMHMQSG